MPPHGPAWGRAHGKIAGLAPTRGGKAMGRHPGMAATGGRAAAKTRAPPGTGLGLRQPQSASILGAAIPTPGSGDDRRRFMPQSHKIRAGGRDSRERLPRSSRRPSKYLQCFPEWFVVKYADWRRKIRCVVLDEGCTAVESAT